MKKLFINYQEPFKAQIKNNIETDDSFFDQYRQAARLLESLLLAQRNNSDALSENVFSSTKDYREHNNNIIAFCGDRGYGKTSVMLSFLEHVKNVSCGISKESCLFSHDSIVKETVISDTIYIEPSTLENEHNILDLLLANMFQNVKHKIEQNSNCVSLDKKNYLLQCFQNVYRTVSLIKDSKSMLEKEFDDEGDLSKLSRMSESIRLKPMFMQLLQAYLSFMCSNNHSKNTVNNVVIIAIDDLDISFSNAYTIAEQIRKYLIIPGLVIFMAIKIPQLQFCIEEYNIRHFQMYMNLKDQKSYVLDDIKNLSYKYIAKLIPLAHRVLLSKLGDIRDVVLYEGGKTCDNPIEHMDEVLSQKTGTHLLDCLGSHSPVMVDNLRDFINVMSIIRSFDSPLTKSGEFNPEILMKNIEKYFFACFIPLLEERIGKDSLYEKIIDLTNFGDNGDFHKEVNMILYTIKQAIEKRNGVPMEWLTISPSTGMHYSSLCDCLTNSNQILLCGQASEEEMVLVEAIKFLYRSRLSYFWRALRLPKNKRQSNFSFLRFTNRLIWGNSINYYMGAIVVENQQISRMRFNLKTNVAYNCIAKKLKLADKFLLADDRKYMERFNTFASDDEKKRYVLSLLIFGMLSNNSYNISTAGFVINAWSYYWGNSRRFFDSIQVSIENYILYMCILDDLPRLLRFDLLEIESEYYEEIIEKLKKYNMRNMENLGVLICNPDYMEKVYNYAFAGLNYDYTGFDDEYIIKNFFQVMNEWLSKLELAYWKSDQNQALNISIFRYGDGENDFLDVSEIYAELFNLLKNDIQRGSIANVSKPIEGLQELLDSLEGRNVKIPYGDFKFIRKARKNATVRSLKKNILNMAKEIGLYIYLSHDFAYLNGEWKDNIIRVFIAFSGENFSSGNPIAPAELIKEYNSLAERFDYNWLRMRIDELKLKFKS